MFVTLDLYRRLYAEIKKKLRESSTVVYG